MAVGHDHPGQQKVRDPGRLEERDGAGDAGVGPERLGDRRGSFPACATVSLSGLEEAE
jgi:hypothetical protein